MYSMIKINTNTHFDFLSRVSSPKNCSSLVPNILLKKGVENTHPLNAKPHIKGIKKHKVV